jgi:cytochrome c biogenesis protein CcmG/thiol:disulfide interchange protein DsbE
MKRSVIAVVAVVVALMLFAGVRSSRRRHASGPALTPSASIGKPAPDFTLEDLEGKQVRLSDFRGKAVLLDFWETTCGPCKVEIPWLVELQNQYRAQGLEIVGVALDDSGRANIQKFAKEMGMNYTILQGRDGVGDEYGVIGWPTTYFIDRSGKIVEADEGLVSRGEIESNIKKALQTKS